MDAMFAADDSPSAATAPVAVIGKSLQQLERDVRVSAGLDLLLGEPLSSPEVRSPLPGDKIDFSHLKWQPHQHMHQQRHSNYASSIDQFAAEARGEEDEGEEEGERNRIKAAIPRNPLDRKALEDVRRAAMVFIPHAMPPPRLPATTMRENQHEHASAASAWLAAEKQKAIAAKKLIDDRVERVRQVAERARQKLQASTKPQRSVTINILPAALVATKTQAPSSSSRPSASRHVSSSASLPGSGSSNRASSATLRGSRNNSNNTADDAEPRIRGSHPSVPRLSANYLVKSFQGGRDEAPGADESILPSPGVAIVPRRQRPPQAQDVGNSRETSFEETGPRTTQPPRQTQQSKRNEILPSPGVEIRARVGYETSIDMDMSAFNASLMNSSHSSGILDVPAAASSSAQDAKEAPSRTPVVAATAAAGTSKLLTAVAEDDDDGNGDGDAGRDLPTPRTKLSLLEAQEKKQRRELGKQYAEARRAQLAASRRTKQQQEQALQEKKQAALAALAARSRTFAGQPADPAALRRIVYVRESAQMVEDIEVDDAVPTSSRVATASALNWSLAGDESNIEGDEVIIKPGAVDVQARLSRGLAPLPTARTSVGAAVASSTRGAPQGRSPRSSSVPQQRPPQSAAVGRSRTAGQQSRSTSTPLKRPSPKKIGGRISISNSSGTKRPLKPASPPLKSSKPVTGVKPAFVRSSSAPPRSHAVGTASASTSTSASKVPSMNATVRFSSVKPLLSMTLRPSSAAGRPHKQDGREAMMHALSIDMDVTDLLNATIGEEADGQRAIGSTDRSKKSKNDKKSAAKEIKAERAVPAKAPVKSTAKPAGGNRLVSPVASSVRGSTSGRPVSAASRRYGSVSESHGMTMSSEKMGSFAADATENEDGAEEVFPEFVQTQSIEALSRTMRGLPFELQDKRESKSNESSDDGPESLQSLRRSIQCRLSEGIQELTTESTTSSPAQGTASPDWSFSSAATATTSSEAAAATSSSVAARGSPSKLHRVGKESSLLDPFAQSFGGVGRPTFRDVAIFTAHDSEGDNDEVEEQAADMSLSFDNPFDISDHEGSDAIEERLRFGPGTPSSQSPAQSPSRASLPSSSSSPSSSVAASPTRPPNQPLPQQPLQEDEEVLEEIEEEEVPEELDESVDAAEQSATKTNSGNNSSSSRAEQDDSVLLTASVDFDRRNDDDVELARGDRDSYGASTERSDMRGLPFTLAPEDVLDIYTEQEKEDIYEEQEREEERHRDEDFGRIIEREKASSSLMRQLETADVAAARGLLDDRNDVVQAFAQSMTEATSHPDGSFSIAHRAEPLLRSSQSSPVAPESLQHSPLSTAPNSSMPSPSLSEPQALDPVDQARLRVLANAKKKMQLEIEIKMQKRLSSPAGISLRNVGSLASMLRSNLVVFNDDGEEEPYKDSQFSFEPVDDDNDENETNLVNMFASKLLVEQTRLEKERLVADAARDAMKLELKHKAKLAREAAGILALPSYMRPKETTEEPKPAVEVEEVKTSPSRIAFKAAVPSQARSPTNKSATSTASSTSTSTSASSRLSPPGRASLSIKTTMSPQNRKIPVTSPTRTQPDSPKTVLEQAKTLRRSFSPKAASPKREQTGGLSKASTQSLTVAPVAPDTETEEKEEEEDKPTFWDSLLSRDPYSAPKHNSYTAEPPPMSAADWEAVRALTEGVLGVGAVPAPEATAASTNSEAAPRLSPSEMQARMAAALQQHDTVHALSLELSQLEQQKAIEDAQAAVQAITNAAEAEQHEFRMRQELSLQQQAYELSLASAVSSVQLSMQAVEGQHQLTLAQLVSRIHEQEIQLKQLEAGAVLRASADSVSSVPPAKSAQRFVPTDAPPQVRARSPRGVREDDDESYYSANFEDESAAETPRLPRKSKTSPRSQLDTASFHSIDDEESIADARSAGNQSTRSISTARSGQAAYRSDNDESIADEVGAVEASPAMRRLARAGANLNDAVNRKGNDSDYSEVFDELSFSEQGNSRYSDSGLDSSDYDRGYGDRGAPKRGTSKPFTSPTRPSREKDRSVALSHSGSLSAVHFKEPEITDSPKRRKEPIAAGGRNKGVRASTSALPIRHAAPAMAPSRSLDSALPRQSTTSTTHMTDVSEYRAEVESRLRSMERGLALRTNLVTAKRDKALNEIATAREELKEKLFQLSRRGSLDAPIAPADQAAQSKQRQRIENDLSSLQEEEEMAQEAFFAEMSSLEKEKWAVSARAYKELRRFHALSREMEMMQSRRVSVRDVRDSKESRDTRSSQDEEPLKVATSESDSDKQLTSKSSPHSRTATVETPASVTSVTTQRIGSSAAGIISPAASKVKSSSTPTPLDTSANLADSTDTIADLERSINLRQARIEEIKENITSIADQKARLEIVKQKQREREQLVVMEERLLRRAQQLTATGIVSAKVPSELDAEVRIKIREMASRLVSPLYLDAEYVMGMASEDPHVGAADKAESGHALEDDSFGSDGDLDMLDPLQAAAAAGSSKSLSIIQARAQALAAASAAKRGINVDLAKEHAIVSALEEADDSFGSDQGEASPSTRQRDIDQDRQIAVLEMAVRKLRLAVQHSQQLHAAKVREQQEAAELAAMTGMSEDALTGTISGKDAEMATMAYRVGLREAEAMLEEERAKVSRQQVKLATEKVVRAAQATLGSTAPVAPSVPPQAYLEPAVVESVAPTASAPQTPSDKGAKSTPNTGGSAVATPDTATRAALVVGKINSILSKKGRSPYGASPGSPALSAPASPAGSSIHDASQLNESIESRQSFASNQSSPVSKSRDSRDKTTPTQALAAAVTATLLAGSDSKDVSAIAVSDFSLQESVQEDQEQPSYDNDVEEDLDEVVVADVSKVDSIAEAVAAPSPARTVELAPATETSAADEGESNDFSIEGGSDSSESVVDFTYASVEESRDGGDADAEDSGTASSTGLYVSPIKPASATLPASAHVPASPIVANADTSLVLDTTLTPSKLSPSFTHRNAPPTPVAAEMSPLSAPDDRATLTAQPIAPASPSENAPSPRSRLYDLSISNEDLSLDASREAEAEVEDAPESNLSTLSAASSGQVISESGSGVAKAVSEIEERLRSSSSSSSSSRSASNASPTASEEMEEIDEIPEDFATEEEEEEKELQPKEEQAEVAAVAAADESVAAIPLVEASPAKEPEENTSAAQVASAPSSPDAPAPAPQVEVQTPAPAEVSSFDAEYEMDAPPAASPAPPAPPAPLSPQKDEPLAEAEAEAEEVEEEIQENLDSFASFEQEQEAEASKVETSVDASLSIITSPTTVESPPASPSPLPPSVPSPPSPANLVLAASLAQSPRPPSSPKSPKAASADMASPGASPLSASGSFSPSLHSSPQSNPFEAAAALPLSPSRDGESRDGLRSPSNSPPRGSPRGSPRSPPRDSPRELSGDVFEDIDSHSDISMSPPGIAGGNASPSSAAGRAILPDSLGGSLKSASVFSSSSVYDDEFDDEDEDMYAFDPVPKVAAPSASALTSASAGASAGAGAGPVNKLALINPQVAAAAAASTESSPRSTPPSPLLANWAAASVDIGKTIYAGADIKDVLARLDDKNSVGPILTLPASPLPAHLAPHAAPVLDRLNDVLTTFHAFRHGLPLPSNVGNSGTGVSLASLGLGGTTLSRRLLAQSMALNEESVNALLANSLNALSASAASVGSQKKHFLELVECSTVEDVQQEFEAAMSRRVDDIVERMLAGLLIECVDDLHVA